MAAMFSISTAFQLDTSVPQTQELCTLGVDGVDPVNNIILYIIILYIHTQPMVFQLIRRTMHEADSSSSI